MPESYQHKLDRVRKPRVQITYDVEIGDAIQKKELPLVVGIMADLSGKWDRTPDEKPTKLKDRKFVEIDRDNFNDILKSIAPRLDLKEVKNTLTNDGKLLPTIKLQFKHLDDFKPLWTDEEEEAPVNGAAPASTGPRRKLRGVVAQVPVLAELLDMRGRLNDLLAKLDGNDDLEAQLAAIVSDQEKLKTIKGQAEAAANAAADKARSDAEAAAAAVKAKSDAEAAAAEKPKTETDKPSEGGPNA